MKKIVALLAAALVAGTVWAGEFPDISITDLNAAIAAKKVVVIDVNGSETWEKNRIPGAVNFETAKKEFAKVLPKDKKALIVAYCGGPQCTAYQAAANAAKELGYKNIKHLSAGISGWLKAGQKTESGS
ncbi:MAG: rhodanese-like domain-containing protein [Verrucomicrobia bacterium]|nr:rhodanese-like domain-containing protein [Verrucomicrobiota bacterium]